MKNRVILLRHQIVCDIKSGILLQYKKFLLFIGVVVFLFLFLNRQVSSYTLIAEDNIIGFWDYLVYLFKGKEKINSLSQTDVFDIPIEWLLIHSYLLFAIGTYPKEEYKERGYQFLLRTGSKWCWWISKGIYIVVAVLFYYSSILLVAFGFCAIKGGNLYYLNKEICYYVIGIDISNFSMSDIIWNSAIMPFILLITLCIAEMFISFLTSSLVSVIILLSYLGVSAYWCKEWLIGNYTMLLRKNELSLTAGIIISCSSSILFFLLGYFYFKQIDVIDRQREELS